MKSDGLHEYERSAPHGKSVLSEARHDHASELYTLGMRCHVMGRGQGNIDFGHELKAFRSFEVKVRTM